MTNQLAAKSEIKPHVDIKTESAESLAFNSTTSRYPFTPSSFEMAENSDLLYIFSDYVSVGVLGSHARELSGRIQKEFLETGRNSDVEVPEDIAHCGDLKDINMIFNHGVEKLIIRDNEHVFQLQKLATFFEIQALANRLNHEYGNILAAAH